MAIDIRIVRARDFIKVTSTGKLDFEKSKESLIEVASASPPQTGYKVILDTRKSQSGMSITELWYLAVELRNLHTSFSKKTAVLCPLERFDYASFFALCARNQGLRVKAFNSFEDAIEWLIAD